MKKISMSKFFILNDRGRKYTFITAYSFRRKFIIEEENERK